MAFTEPTHAYEMLWRFSTKRQAAIGTALSDPDLSLSALVSGFDVGKLSHRLIADADRFGKGHGYATSHRKVAQMTSLQRTVELNDVFAGWVAAFIAADSTPVVAGVLTYVIPEQNPGLVDLVLAPTEGADPVETRYTVNYFLRSGAKYTETWHVPASGGPYTISQVRGTA